jgi:hypothetical protein
MSVVPDYPDSAPHVATAAQIAATGVPLLALPTPVISAIQTLTAGGDYASNFLGVTQLSYEIGISLMANGSGSAGPVEITMQWYDAALTNLVTQETYWVWPGAAGTPHELFGRGPTKGNYCLVTITNASSAMTYRLAVTMYWRSHNYTKDDWRSLSYGSSEAGNNPATNNVPASLVGYRTVSLGASATDTTELPLYAGPVFLWAQTSSSTSDLTLIIENSADNVDLPAGQRIFAAISSSTGLIAQQLCLPRYQCRVFAQNGNASSRTIDWALHIVESSN